MPQDVTRADEKRSFRRLVIGGMIVALLGGVMLTAWPWLPGVKQQSAMTPATAPRSNQSEGVSEAGRTTAAPPQAGSGSSSPVTAGRNAELQSTADRDVQLTTEQKNAVSKFVAEHESQSFNDVNFTVSIGAAVPEKVVLRDLPAALSDKLHGYSGSQYMLLPQQLVIVEKATKRIIAILPVAS